MEDNCFTILWWFLPYINMNWPQGCMCPPILNSPTSSLPTPSSGLSQSTSFWCPASYIILLLVIYFTYGNVHVSMLFSQISHPCLLPLSVKVCYLHLCLLCCPACRIVVTVFLNSVGSVSSVAQTCLTLCDPKDCSTPGFSVYHQLLELAQTSCPLSQWCHPTISSSVIPFFHLQSFPASGSFLVSQSFTSGGQTVGASPSASVLPMNTQDWCLLEWTSWMSLQSKGLSRVFSNTTVQKHQFFGTQLSLWSNSHIHTWPLEKP